LPAHPLFTTIVDDILSARIVDPTLFRLPENPVAADGYVLHALSDSLHGSRLEMPVSKAFVCDAIERSCVSFCASGVAADGRVAHAQLKAETTDKEERAHAVDAALAALAGLAGIRDAGKLTGLLNQCLCTPMLLVLHESGESSPLRLPNGRPVIPGGSGKVHVDLVRLPIGAYHLDVSITCHSLSVDSWRDRDGEMQPLRLDRRNSRLSMRYSIRVSPCMKTIEYVKGSASFTYRFVPIAGPAPDGVA
jgi:hypothetical protein